MSAPYRPPAMRQQLCTSAPPPLEIMEEHVSNDDLPTIPEVVEPSAAVPKRLNKKIFADPYRRIERTTQIIYLAKAIPTLFPSAPSKQDGSQVVESSYSTDHTWLNRVKSSPFEQDRIRNLAQKMVESFVQETTLDSDTIAEIVNMAIFLDERLFRRVLDHLVTLFRQDQGDHLLPGILQLLQEAPIEFLKSGDLDMILKRIQDRIQRLDRSDPAPFEVISAVGRIQDAMLRLEAHSTKERIVDFKRTGKSLLPLEKRKDDPYVVFHISYAFQAMLRSPGNDKVVLNLVQRAKEVTQSESKYVGTQGGSYQGLLDPDMNVEYHGSTLLERASSIFKALKRGSATNHKRGWYDYLKAAKFLALERELEAFEDLVNEAPCRSHPEFQWGISQLLGETALDKEWKLSLRQKAANFLFKLETDSEWTKDKSVKAWISTIRHRVASEAPEMLPSSVSEIVPDDPAVSRPHPLNIRLSCPLSHPVMTKVNEIPGVEEKLAEWRKMVVYRERSIYVPPVAKANLQTSDDNGFLLMKKVNFFLQGEQKVFLLLGDAGAGKSTFFRHLEQQLWAKYTPGGAIPLFIDLPNIQSPETNLIQEHLSKTFGFSNETIQAMKESRDFLLICDGYDERKLNTNLYTSNRLRSPGHWGARLMLSCQTSYLGEEYEQWFKSRPELEGTDGLHQACLVPFGKEEIGDVVQQYVSERKRQQHRIEGTVWTVEMYQSTLLKNKSLIQLTKVPFHLFMALEALPRIVSGAENTSKIKVPLLTLYRSYMDQHFDDIKHRVHTGEISLSSEEMAAYMEMQESTGFKEVALGYMRELAAAIYSKKDRRLVTHDIRAQIIFKLCPLRKVQNTLQFKHRSLLQYFFACYVFEGTSSNDSEEILRRLGDYPLVQSGVLKEFSIVFLLAERALEDCEGFQKILHQGYKRTSDKSFKDPASIQAAVNAVTILVRAGVSFNNADLRSIAIPGADLSCGLFDCADFREADLNGVSFNKTWLRNADFTHAEMSQVQFGARVSLMLGKTFRTCAYSRDGQYLALGSDKGDVDIFEISSRSHCSCVRHFGAAIASLAISGTGLMATGGEKSEVRISHFLKKDLSTPPLILKGHQADVSCVAFSLDSLQVATASYDKTVRIWDASTGECIRVLNGHDDEVLCVAWSPDGTQVVSGSQNGHLLLWNVKTGNHSSLYNGGGYKLSKVLFAPSGQHIAVAYGYDVLLQTLYPKPPLCLKGHSSDVTAMSFSPDGQWLVSSSRDQSVRIWCAKTGREITKLCGHANGVYDTVFLDDHEISTCSRDRTARFWNLSRELAAARMGSYGPHAEQRGHTSLVSMVAYSPTGQHLFSSSWDRTIRKWDVGTGESEALDFGPSGRIEGVAYSPDGKHLAVADQGEKITLRVLPGSNTMGGQVPALLPISGHCMAYSPCGRWFVSGSKDGRVKLWDLKERKQVFVPEGHYAAVNCIAFSPQGHQFATGSDDRNVRLWDISSGSPCSEVVGRHQGDICDLAFSPCGRMVVTGSGDRTARIWDLVHRTETLVLESPRCWIRSVAWSPCGQWIACGFDRKTVQIWGRHTSGDTVDGQTEWRCRAALDLFLGYVRCVAWNPNPGVLEFITGGGDHIVYAWTINLDSPDVQKANLSIKLKWWSDTRLVTVGAKFAEAHGLDEEQRQVLLQGSDEYAFEASVPREDVLELPSSRSPSPSGPLFSAFKNNRFHQGSGARGVMRGKTRYPPSKSFRHLQQSPPRLSGDWRVDGQRAYSAAITSGVNGGARGDDMIDGSHSCGASFSTSDGGYISDEDQRPMDAYEE
ncbi:hypothetical protein EMPS_07301 [Entomortierella parvispora]|uniref:NACHT domain-containing protein n=1 Tax=Entomortierella parvispora TaxID=205924 RepID=A0A9P3HEN3_9FUNG|nr:hypothetical protein EMPS_07301 [Entomortierella parvispora]